MAKITKIPGRSGYYIRVVVPRGELREVLGTCDVVKKIGKTYQPGKYKMKPEEVYRFIKKVR